MAASKSSKSAGNETTALDDWLRLQQRLARRTSNYLQSLGELVGQGSLEPREYIEQSAKMWAAVVGDVGDFLNPGSGLKFDDSQVAVSYVTQSLPRGRSSAVPIVVPAHLFHPEDQDVVVRLTTDGLIRQFHPDGLGRPPLVLEPERHLRLDFTSDVGRSAPGAGSGANTRQGLDVRFDVRTFVELKLYDLPDTMNASEVYEGVVWGDVHLPVGGEETRRRLPVAVVALTVE